MDRDATSTAVRPRRALLRGAAGLLALGAAGCGFRPIHGGGAAAGADADVAADMAATRIALIPDRFGQLTRRALQQRLGQGPGGPANARWELLVGPSQSGEATGIQRDGAATRVRIIATANWTLLRLTPRETVANGFERTLDAYNIQGVQLFAADASREAMERRLAEQLADEVALRLAMQFRRLREGGTGQRIEPVEAPTPMHQSLPLPAGATLTGPVEGVAGGPASGIGPRDGFR
jgi:LPS-assembly lipoprotein